VQGVQRLKELRRIQYIEENIEGPRVLDAGCGEGLLIKRLLTSKKNLWLYGFDLSIYRLKEIPNHERLEIKQADIYHTGYEDDFFDTVVCSEVIEHLTEPLQAIKELLRICKKKLIITVPYKETIKFDKCIYCGKNTPRSGHLHSYDEDNIKKLFLQNKSIITKVQKIVAKSFVNSPFEIRIVIGFSSYRFNRWFQSVIPFSLFKFLDSMIFKSKQGDPAWLLIKVRKLD